jgi:hypothetical protein
MRNLWRIVWRIADSAYYLSLLGTPLLVIVFIHPLVLGSSSESVLVVLTRCAKTAALGVVTFAVSVVIARAAWRRFAHEV